MEITVSWIFGGLVTIVTAVITWSLKELYSRSKSDKDDTNEKIEKLQADIKENAKEAKQSVDEVKKEFETHKQKLPEKYVLKDEFNREINKLDQKLDDFKNATYERLDAVKDEIMELNKSIASLVATVKNKRE